MAQLQPSLLGRAHSRKISASYFMNRARIVAPAGMNEAPLVTVDANQTKRNITLNRMHNH